MNICSCCNEREAVIQFKNGNYCCETSINKCPAKIEKDRLKKVGKNPFEGKHHPRKGKKGGTSWNKGLTKETNEDVKIHADNLKKRFELGELVGHQKGKNRTIEEKTKISQTMKLNPNAGGYRQGSGVGKKGWYKGFWCDSSYELVYVIYNLDHNIKFKRNTKKFEYEYKNKKHNYIPDFIEGNYYVEIKGYENGQTYAKYKCLGDKLKVLKKSNMTHMFDYVETTYSKDFISMYE